MKLHWFQELKVDIKDFSSGVWGWPAPPQRGDVNYFIIWCIWIPYLISSVYKTQIQDHLALQYKWDFI